MVHACIRYTYKWLLWVSTHGCSLKRIWYLQSNVSSNYHWWITQKIDIAKNHNGQILELRPTDHLTLSARKVKLSDLTVTVCWLSCCTSSSSICWNAATILEGSNTSYEDKYKGKQINKAIHNNSNTDIKKQPPVYKVLAKGPFSSGVKSEH